MRLNRGIPTLIRGLALVFWLLSGGPLRAGRTRTEDPRSVTAALSRLKFDRCDGTFSAILTVTVEYPFALRPYTAITVALSTAPTASNVALRFMPITLSFRPGFSPDKVFSQPARVEGSLRDVCADGSLVGQAEYAGPNANSVRGVTLTSLETIPAQGFRLPTGFPKEADLLSALDFEARFTVDCCSGTGGTTPFTVTVDTATQVNVTIASVTPDRFTCSAAGSQTTVVVRGRKVRADEVGSFLVVVAAPAGAGGRVCRLGPVLVEAE
jgi:hypothetical protein